MRYFLCLSDFIYYVRFFRSEWNASIKEAVEWAWDIAKLSSENDEENL